MIQVQLIDEQGFFTGESKFISQEDLTDLTITKPILTGYVRTKWNGTDWEEGATAEEVQLWKDANTAPTPQPNKIDNLEARVATQEAVTDALLFDILPSMMGL